MIVIFVVDVAVGAETVSSGVGIEAVRGVEIACNDFGYFHGVVGVSVA